MTAPLWAGMRTDVNVGGDYDNDGKWEPAELQGRDWYSSKLAAPIHYDPVGLPTAIPDFPTPAPSGHVDPGDPAGPGRLRRRRRHRSRVLRGGRRHLVDQRTGRLDAVRHAPEPQRRRSTGTSRCRPTTTATSRPTSRCSTRTDHSFHILQSKTGTERVVRFPNDAALMPVVGRLRRRRQGRPGGLEHDRARPGGSPRTRPRRPTSSRRRPPPPPTATPSWRTTTATRRPTSRSTTWRTTSCGPGSAGSSPPSPRCRRTPPGSRLPQRRARQLRPAHVLREVPRHDEPHEPERRRSQLAGLPAPADGLRPRRRSQGRSGLDLDRPAPGTDSARPPRSSPVAPTTSSPPATTTCSPAWEPATVSPSAGGPVWRTPTLTLPYAFPPSATATYPTWAPFSGPQLLAVPADYDGDRKTDPTYYVVATGHWWIRGYATAGDPRHRARATGGLDWDVPVPGDYVGRGGWATPAVYRPSDSTLPGGEERHRDDDHRHRPARRLPGAGRLRRRRQDRRRPPSAPRPASGSSTVRPPAPTRRSRTRLVLDPGGGRLRRRRQGRPVDLFDPVSGQWVREGIGTMATLARATGPSRSRRPSPSTPCAWPATTMPARPGVGHAVPRPLPGHPMTRQLAQITTALHDPSWRASHAHLLPWSRRRDPPVAHPRRSGRAPAPSPVAPVPGDVTGDRKADALSVDRADGTWHRIGSPAVLFTGQPTDVIVPGDYDGDGTLGARRAARHPLDLGEGGRRRLRAPAPERTVGMPWASRTVSAPPR